MPDGYTPKDRIGIRAVLVAAALDNDWLLPGRRHGQALGHFDRVLTYTEGRIRAESRDTTGDGHFDRLEHFDARGDLQMREEDVNGDKAIDVRTAYDSGRIIRREILNPEALSLFQ